MVRPTRSLVVTGLPISAARSGMKSAEKEIIIGLICRQKGLCTRQGSGRVINAWAIAKVAGTRQLSSQKLRAIGAGLVAGGNSTAGASESSVFRGISAVQLHVKVRRYDAAGC